MAWNWEKINILSQRNLKIITYLQSLKKVYSSFTLVKFAFILDLGEITFSAIVHKEISSPNIQGNQLSSATGKKCIFLNPYYMFDSILVIYYSRGSTRARNGVIIHLVLFAFRCLIYIWKRVFIHLHIS